MLDLDVLRSFVRKGDYEITLHMRQRMGLRKITMGEVKTVILTGEVIEYYNEARPYPACLIMGKIRNGFPLYVVCALSDKKAHLITAHWMDPERWLDPQTRRDRK